MIIGNGCRENIDHSITQSERCHTKGKKMKKIWPNLIKRHGWMRLKG